MQPIRKIALVFLSLAVLVSLCILLYYLSASPAQNTDIGDGGFLSQQPCGPPCFHGIYPGITTEQDARTVMQGLDDTCTDWDYTSSSGNRGVNCRHTVLSFTDQTTASITFYPTSTMTVSQVFDKYGLPDRMLVFISSVLPDEPQRSRARLFYDRLHSLIDLDEQDRTKFEIRADTSISSIAYFTRDDYQEYLDIVIGLTAPWADYGIYAASP